MIRPKLTVRGAVVFESTAVRFDAQAGAELLREVAKAAAVNARCFVLHFHPSANVDFAGARALVTASALLGGGRFRVSGLGARSRTTLRTTGAAAHVGMYEWWTDAVEPFAAAA
jgi:hypothetical protein